VESVQSVSGVSNVHRVILEYVGPQIRADIHINMDPRLSLDRVHRVSDAVSEKVEALDDVEHAFIHVEPLGED
jgi:divalent metal cation (Fe/Co/Zn/Cd) transporter